MAELQRLHHRPVMQPLHHRLRCHLQLQSQADSNRLTSLNDAVMEPGGVSTLALQIKLMVSVPTLMRPIEPDTAGVQVCAGQVKY